MFLLKPSAHYPQKCAAAAALLKQASEQHAGKIKLACSLGAEDMVLAHMIEAARLPIPLFVLQTRQLHQETLDLLDAVQHWKTPVEVYEPLPQAIAMFVQANGQDAMYKSVALRKECCALRKLEPLARALAGTTAWIVGLRHEQSTQRAQVQTIETEANGRTKYSPLVDWTQGDVWHYIRSNHVPYNVLHDQFYPSIGCKPCTRAVTLGEDPRSGRWWWESENAKECGLHVK